MRVVGREIGPEIGREIATGVRAGAGSESARRPGRATGATIAKLRADLARIAPRAVEDRRALPRCDRPARNDETARAPLALMPHALLELRVVEASARAAASALAFALAGAHANDARASGGASGRIVVIALAHAAREDGVIFGRGLSAFGLDPGRILAVFARNERELLWAGEEAARTRGLGLVLIEAPAAARRLDLTATRRLSLAAESSGAAPVLIRTDREAPPTAAAARFLVAPALSAGARDDPASPGAARWRIAIERFRPNALWCAHPPFEAEWRHERRDFDVRPAAEGAGPPHRLSHPAVLAGRAPDPAQARNARAS